MALGWGRIHVILSFMNVRIKTVFSGSEGTRKTWERGRGDKPTRDHVFLVVLVTLGQGLSLLKGVGFQLIRNGLLV